MLAKSRAGAFVIWLAILPTPGPATAAEKDITIAAVGPMTGAAAARGKDLQDAVRMATEEANAAGGIKGHRIELVVYDDGDEPARARELASKIASGPAVAVLGQVASSAGMAAGAVYREQHIPAITGAASQSTVTQGNDWFFRVLPDSAGQGRFLADYARYQFGARAIAIVRETGTAGEEFASALRDRAKTKGIRISLDIEFPPSDARDTARMADLASKLAKLPKGEIIALGTQYAETPAVLRALHDRLGPFRAMGYSSVATVGLSSQFAEEEASRNAPGFYTEDFTVAAPQLPDVAEYAQTIFASRFLARYKRDASPEAVRWYEAAHLVLDAIAATGADGSKVPDDRRRIRDWLGSRNNRNAAVEGVAGPIYFDPDHNVQQGISVGVFHGGRLISAPVQFTPVGNPEQVPGWDKLRSSGAVIDTGEMKIVKTPVVYSGMEINTLDNIDVRTGTFSADFFLWFRYQDGTNLDPHEVEFPTVVSGGQLGQEVLHSSHGGFTTVTYHVKGVYRADYEFSRFPFDRQNLKIPVQIRNSSSYSMILAYGGSPSENTAHRSSPLANRLWKLRNQIFFRDIAAYRSSFGETPSGAAGSDVEVNRINAECIIERDVFGFAVKNFLPLLCILVALLIGYALGADVINPRVSIGVTALLTTSVLYQKMAGDLPTVTYITAIDYVFFAFFAFCVTFLALTVVTYETHKNKMNKLTKILNQAGLGVTLAGLAGTLMFVWVRYWGQV
jgi:ABC-type branched-subunit amino acid transport system substrate-binding protein